MTRILTTVFSDRNCIVLALICAAMLVSVVASPEVFGDVM